MGIAVADLCPHCNRILKPVHAFEADGECLKFYRCPQDGDVVPKRAPLAVAYPEADPAPRAKWSVPC
jgi:hypothetical protein